MKLNLVAGVLAIVSAVSGALFHVLQTKSLPTAADISAVGAAVGVGIALIKGTAPPAGGA